MTKSRGIITTAFGNRTNQLKGLVANLKKYTDLPLTVFADREYDFVDTMVATPYWKGHPRCGQRNGDYFQALGALDCDFDEVLYLDDDMRIVSKDFEQGFKLAEMFGVCLPINPRHFIGVDGKIGADSAGYPKQLSRATAYNCGTMFVDRTKSKAIDFLSAWASAMRSKPTRGPMLVWEASKRTMHPYALTDEWCACARHAAIENPIILHCGHEPCMKRYNREFK